MQDSRPHGRMQTQTDAEPTVGGWARLDTETIFRELIAQELRAGRLTRAGRKRIVQYAAQLGLSAVDAGRLIEQCRGSALQSVDPAERRHALKLVEDSRGPRRLDTKGALIVAAVMALQMLLIGWLATNR